MKEETIIQILNSLTTVGEKSLDDLTGVSEYLAYLQNPLGATLNYLITGR